MPDESKRRAFFLSDLFISRTAVRDRRASASNAAFTGDAVVVSLAARTT
jgi:hypothetical protein